MKKLLVIGIIALFIGLAFIPSFNAVSISTTSDDTTPPVTTISLNPSEPNGNNGFYISDVEITLNTTDDISGVNATYYFKGMGNPEIYTEPFWETEEANNLIGYYSIDYAGNIENWKSANIYIDKTPPEVNLYREKIGESHKFTSLAVDYISGVERVEFYLNGIKEYTAYNNSYEWYFNGSSGVVVAIAYDFAGHNASQEIAFSKSFLTNSHSSDSEEDCIECQSVNRVDISRVKLLLLRTEVVLNIILSKFRDIPEIKDKCEEILDTIDSNRALNFQIICGALYVVLVQLKDIYDYIKSLYDYYWYNTSIIGAILSVPLMYSMMFIAVTHDYLLGWYRYLCY